MKTQSLVYPFLIRVAFALFCAVGIPNKIQAFTLTFYPASTWSANTTAMDATFGITGYFIEDFEDRLLIPGLSISYTGNGFNTTQTILIQTLDFAIDASWDGLRITSNDPNNNVPPDSGVPWAQRTTFNFPSGARSFGIALSGFQSVNPPSDYPITNHRIYINGVAMTTDIETLAGVNWVAARSLRNCYVRIDAAPNETITSVGFENISGNDFLHFDHLALLPVPTDVTVVPGVNIRTAVEISWSSELNKSYQVQWTPLLETDTTWFNLGSAVLGNGSTNYMFDNTRTSDKKFYRVLKFQ